MKFEAQYARAKRFDEANAYQGEAYIALTKRRVQLEEQLEAVYGVGVRIWLEEYAGVYSDLAELECRHFFEEGCRMTGKEEQKRAL